MFISALIFLLVGILTPRKSLHISKFEQKTLLQRVNTGKLKLVEMEKMEKEEEMVRERG